MTASGVITDSSAKAVTFTVGSSCIKLNPLFFNNIPALDG